MSNNEITRTIRRIQKDVQQYASLKFPQMAARKGLRFIDDNFRNQSFAGLPKIDWKRRKGNKDAGRGILTKRGVLRRSFRATTTPGQTRIYTDVKYAQAHNEGLRETVNVPAHTRRKMAKQKVEVAGQLTRTGKQKMKTVKVQTGEISVSAHTKQMNIPRRQFVPTATRPSSVFDADLKKQVTLDMMKILKGRQ